MAPTGWATVEEREFLKTYLPEYESCQVKRKYRAFWQRLNVDYFARFPILQKLFPGRSLTDLSEEEKGAYTAATNKQQQRLKEWFRWQMNPRSRNAGGSITKKDLNLIYNGRTRGRKPYEVFAKLYQTQVEAEKSARCESQGIKGRAQLAVWHEVAKDLYKAATEEQLTEVKKAMDAATESKGGLEPSTEDVAGSPSTYLRYLKKLPTLLNHAITPAVQKAGVIALVYVVGPDPAKGGRIATQTLQFGDKPTTPLFSEDWADHDGLFLEEIARFAGRHEFPPEVCAARSLDAKPPQIDSDLEEGGPANVNETITKDTTGITVEPVEAPKSPPTSPPSTPVSRSISIPQVPFLNNRPSSPQNDRRSSMTLEDDEDQSDEEDDIYGFTSGGDDTFQSSSDNSGWGFSEAQWDVFDTTLEQMQTASPEKSRGEGERVSTASKPHPLPPITPARPSMPTASSASSGGSMSQPVTQSLYLTTPSVTLPVAQAQTTSMSGLPYLGDGSSGHLYQFGGGMNFPPASSSLSTLPSVEVDYVSGGLSNANLFASFFNPPAINAPNPPSSSAHVNSTDPPNGPLNPTFSSASQFAPPSSFSITQSMPPPPAPRPQQAPMNPSSSHVNATNPSNVSLNPTFSVSQFAPASRASVSQTLPPPPTPQSQQTSMNAQSHLAAPPPPTNLPPLRTPCSLVDPPPVPPTKSPSTKEAPLTSFQGACLASTSGRTVLNLNATPPAPPMTQEASLPEQIASSGPTQHVPPPAKVLPPATVPVTMNTASSNASFITQPDTNSNPDLRNEQLQLIGTNACTVAESTEKPKDAGDVGWFEAATKSLRELSLGQGFSEMRDKWEKLEVMLGCGNISRGSLPDSKKRPKEWARWASKTWQGMRCYDSAPDIEDPADIGLTTTLWWSSFQPSFRASDGPYPKAIYSDPDAEVNVDVWAPIRKSGPNGFVSMVMLLAWWGRAALTGTSEWQQNSQLAWEYVVKDVSHVLDRMIETYGPPRRAGVKRKVANEKENAPPSKKKAKKRS
ncbi:hypothetical protein NMY22_g10106 [Coprinellus aureogranulatus]|nr:hypothetical protein NMY22_g10106 [Coprinellus aureogranulatus]